MRDLFVAMLPLRCVLAAREERFSCDKRRCRRRSNRADIRPSARPGGRTSPPGRGVVSCEFRYPKCHSTTRHS